MLKKFMANYTKFYIKGERDGKPTRIFESNLNKAIKAARKIGMKPTSKDAYGYDAKKKKWVPLLKASDPRRATAKSFAIKDYFDKIANPRSVTAKSLLKKTPVLLKKQYEKKDLIKSRGKKTSKYLMPIVKLMGEKIKTAKSETEANQARKALLKRFSKDLPSTIMGRKNYNTAVKNIDNYLKKGNYVGASNYMVGQLFKLENQLRGTGSYKYVADKLGDWYGTHLKFDE